MMYLLDTNICIYIIKNRFPSIIEKIKSHHPDDIKISSITVAELEYGVAKSQLPEKNRIALTKFLSPFEILPFTDLDAEYFGRIRASLEKSGRIIGAYDMLIASQGLSAGLTIVTNNEREFNRVPTLKVENWAEER